MQLCLTASTCIPARTMQYTLSVHGEHSRLAPVCSQCPAVIVGAGSGLAHPVQPCRRGRTPPRPPTPPAPPATSPLPLLSLPQQHLDHPAGRAPPGLGQAHTHAHTAQDLAAPRGSSRLQWRRRHVLSDARSSAPGPGSPPTPLPIPLPPPCPPYYPSSPRPPHVHPHLKILVYTLFLVYPRLAPHAEPRLHVTVRLPRCLPVTVRRLCLQCHSLQLQGGSLGPCAPEPRAGGEQGGQAADVAGGVRAPPTRPTPPPASAPGRPAKEREMEGSNAERSEEQHRRMTLGWPVQYYIVMC